MPMACSCTHVMLRTRRANVHRSWTRMGDLLRRNCKRELKQPSGTPRTCNCCRQSPTAMTWRWRIVRVRCSSTQTIRSSTFDVKFVCVRALTTVAQECRYVCCYWKLSTILSHVGCPGSTIFFAISSTSMTLAPCFANIDATRLFPDAMFPVRPKIFIWVL